MTVPTSQPDRLTVTFSVTQHGYAASSDSYPVTGFGATPIDALVDLQAALQDYSDRFGLSRKQLPTFPSPQ